MSGDNLPAALEQASALNKLRADSILKSAALASQIADSMRAASVRASLSETAAERQRSDSLRRLSELTNLRLDSLRRSAAQTQRQRDSVQTLATISAKQIDSLRGAAAAASRGASTTCRRGLTRGAREIPRLRQPSLGMTQKKDDRKRAARERPQQNDDRRPC